MYEYARKRFIPSTVSTGFGADTYRAASSTTSSLTPYAIARTNVQNIAVHCYENMPREQILATQVPYTMELSVPGRNFTCIGNPSQECPESVHRGTDPKDPWRQRQCAAWRQTWERQAADIIASQGFRDQVTENILNAAGVTGWRRWFTQGAEFVQVLDEKERRERAIKITAFVALAAGAGGILWTFLKKKPEPAGEIAGNPRRLSRGDHGPPIEFGDGEHLPSELRGFVAGLFRAMLKSAASANLKPHHVAWVCKGGVYYIGNRVYGPGFGFFEVWPGGDEDKVYYKTSSKWTRFRHGQRYDAKEQVGPSEAMEIARRYYTGRRDELIALEGKAKAKFGRLSRSYVVWNARTHRTEEFHDDVERNPRGYYIEPAERTGAKKLSPDMAKREVYRHPGWLPDHAPGIVRQIFRKLMESAQIFGQGKIIGGATPVCIRTVSYSTSTDKWNWQWVLGTYLGDKLPNAALGYFVVDNDEKVWFAGESTVYSDSDHVPFELYFKHGKRLSISHEKALLIASTYYQDLEGAGVI